MKVDSLASIVDSDSDLRTLVGETSDYLRTNGEPNEEVWCRAHHYVEEHLAIVYYGNKEALVNDFKTYGRDIAAVIAGRGIIFYDQSK